MSKIKGKDTQLEEEGWALLRESGIRYRKHLKGIPGKPDAANKRKRLAIFIDSEFWHGFEWKKRKKDFKSNKKFWIPKIERNIARDREVNRVLKAAGWTVIRLWERDLHAKQRDRTIRKLQKIWKSLYK